MLLVVFGCCLLLLMCYTFLVLIGAAGGAREDHVFDTELFLAGGADVHGGNPSDRVAHHVDSSQPGGRTHLHPNPCQSRILLTKSPSLP